MSVGGGGTSVGGVAYPWGGLTLVLTWLMASRAGGNAIYGGKAKILLFMKPLELQYYFAPFSKATN